jgi:hypothetical protein
VFRGDLSFSTLNNKQDVEFSRQLRPCSSSCAIYTLAVVWVSVHILQLNLATMNDQIIDQGDNRPTISNTTAAHGRFPLKQSLDFCVATSGLLVGHVGPTGTVARECGRSYSARSDSLLYFPASVMVLQTFVVTTDVAANGLLNGVFHHIGQVFGFNNSYGVLLGLTNGSAFSAFSSVPSPL